MTRIYPVFAKQSLFSKWFKKQPTPISFICVQFSNEFKHNIDKSTSVHASQNEFIVVENTSNLFFNTLGQAINHGIEQASHDLMVIVHEDVLLLPGWQEMFENSLSELEKHDPNWGLLGVVGWDFNESGVGHWSDPHTYTNTFLDNNFIEIQRPDEQLLIIKKSSGLRFDPSLPSIHNIGDDLARTLKNTGKKIYAVNAPTIHKYADAYGSIILKSDDSIKIINRNSLTYQADKDCCDDYLANKWHLQNVEQIIANIQPTSADLPSPIILLGRGGGGTRLLSTMAKDVGLFIGNNVNISGDCLEMVSAIYRSIMRKYQYKTSDQKELIVNDLKTAANEMITNLDQGTKWGFKLPECLLILPEIQQAFPNARYIHFKREPSETILRRNHMTARLDNHIGRTALAAAYDFFSFPRQQILSDNEMQHMATTTVHQLALAEAHREIVGNHNWLELKMSETINNPGQQLEKLSQFLELDICTTNIVDEIDTDRIQAAYAEFNATQIQSAKDEISSLIALSGHNLNDDN